MYSKFSSLLFFKILFLLLKKKIVSFYIRLKSLRESITILNWLTNKLFFPQKVFRLSVSMLSIAYGAAVVVGASSPFLANKLITVGFVLIFSRFLASYIYAQMWSLSLQNKKIHADNRPRHTCFHFLASSPSCWSLW